MKKNESTMMRNVAKIILPIAVIALSAGGAMWLVSLRNAPPRRAQPAPGPLVEVLTVAASDIAVEVNGRGEVSPKSMVNVVPQVGGVIVEIHRSLAAGGFVQAGELLVRIDPRDYELAVARAEAAVARAQTSVDRETAEADIARGEWYAMHPDTDPPSGLVVREPQIRQAQAELVAAEADLATAQLALDRTRITAPFDAVVASEHIDLGQYVPAGQSLALLYGTEAVEIRVPLQDQELAWFEVPRRTDAPGPAAMVRSHFAGADQEWHGRVTRLEADVDSRSRMVRVVVEVGDPFDASAGRPPLLPGTFVDVGIAGRTLEDVIAIPRYALRDGDIVWVADNGRLQRRGVIVVRREPSVVLVSGGLQSGESLILTSISAVTDGMKIRTRPAAVEGTGMLADVQPGGESS